MKVFLKYDWTHFGYPTIIPILILVSKMNSFISSWNNEIIGNCVILLPEFTLICVCTWEKCMTKMAYFGANKQENDCMLPFAKL